MTYLDYAASSVIDERVVKKMLSIYQMYPGNASSRTHLFGDNCRRIVEKARAQLAETVGADSDEVFFTSGATEADNLAILGLLKYGMLSEKKHIISTSIEHKAVLNPLKQAKSLGFEIDLITPDSSGAVSEESIKNAIRKDTLLISMMHVNNETGVIQPVKEIGDYLSTYDNPPFFHIDAAQSAGKLIGKISQTNFDFLSVSAHKMYGPQGIGALIIKNKDYRKPPLKPIMFGGGQEKGFRSGTLPVALIAGFGEAAHLCLEEWQNDFSNAKKIKELILEAFEESGIDYCLNGAGDVLPNILNVRFSGVSSEGLMIAGKPFFAISNGSACSSSAYLPSYVLQQMGLSDDHALQSVRLSWGRGSNPEEVHAAIYEMINLVKAYQ